MCVHKKRNNVRVIKYLDLCFMIRTQQQQQPQSYFDFIEN